MPKYIRTFGNMGNISNISNNYFQIYIMYKFYNSYFVHFVNLGFLYFYFILYIIMKHRQGALQELYKGRVRSVAVLQERCRVRIKRAAAPRSVTGALQDQDQERGSAQERCRSVAGVDAEDE